MNAPGKEDIKLIPGSKTVVGGIPVVFANTKHATERHRGRGITNKEAMDLVKKALPMVFDAISNKTISKKRDGKPFFTVIDKQSRLLVGCSIEDMWSPEWLVVFRTVFFVDQYHKVSKMMSIFYVNDSNPSREWEESEYYGNLYPSEIMGQYREYEKVFDPEHPEYHPYWRKDRQIEDLWASQGNRRKDMWKTNSGYSRINKWFRNNYDKAVERSERQNADFERMNGMDYSLEDALADADRRILTKGGPNGSLRGIDRRRKADERRLDKIVTEEIRKYYANI